jgi:DNA-binding transcriptional ArsR family regulator
VEAAARVHRALGHEIRLAIVRALAARGELSGAALHERFRRSQPTMVAHFAKLRSAGLLRVRKAGARNFYALNHRLLRRCGITLSR